jgi:hypothetical protein
MTLAVSLFGLFVVALGIAGVVSPRRLLALVTRVQLQMGLYSIAGIRLLLGMALLLSASTSRAPLYFQLLGGLSLVSGLVTPFFGNRRLEAVLEWWRRRPPWVVRLWSVFVALFGASLVWAVLPLERAA